MELPSKALQKAVEKISQLPGVGKRSALRFALHLLQQNDIEFKDFVDALSRLKTDVHRCKRCHCVCDNDICDICANPKRQDDILCIVENIQEVMAIENTQQYKGLYHVLGGVISPIDGIGIHDLTIDELLQRLQQEKQIHEVILALPTTMEGDTTNFYLNKQIFPLGIKVTTLSRGVAIGDNLEYTDEITLGKSITNRIPFNN